MIPRAIYTIFEALNDENIANDYKVTVSHLEIYNEQLRDLLANDPVAELQLLQQQQEQQIMQQQQQQQQQQRQQRHQRHQRRNPPLCRKINPPTVPLPQSGSG